MTIYNHTLSDTLGTPSTLTPIQYRLLGIKHISLRRVHHAQPPKCLSRRQHGCKISCTRHNQRICTTLIEVEHTIGQKPFLNQRQVHAVTPERSLNLILSSSLYYLIPSLITNQIVQTNQLVHIFIVTIELRIMQGHTIIIQSSHSLLKRPLGKEPCIDHQLNSHQPTCCPKMLPTYLYNSYQHIHPHSRPYQPVSNRYD